ncbi:MAG TPA: hypothetical protein VMV10_05940, partial [Pirellulales bacterium]|nr:hypothetical protein [Pirellulales bacterium]
MQEFKQVGRSRHDDVIERIKATIRRNTGDTPSSLASSSVPSVLQTFYFSASREDSCGAFGGGEPRMKHGSNTD